MTTISFITQDGTVKSGQASSGSVMELAVRLGVAGIEGQCGGSMSCGTCHVRLPED